MASERVVLAVPRKRLHPSHAPSTPVAACPVIRHPTGLSQKGYTLLVLTTLFSLRRVARPDGALGVGFIGPGPAKINKGAIAQVTGDTPVEPRHRRRSHRNNVRRGHASPPGRSAPRAPSSRPDRKTSPSLAGAQHRFGGVAVLLRALKWRFARSGCRSRHKTSRRSRSRSRTPGKEPVEPRRTGRRSASWGRFRPCSLGSASRASAPEDVITKYISQG